MNAYVINTDKNEKYIKQISEKELMDHSIEDIINDINLKYDLCTINSFKIDSYREENGEINGLYLQVKGKPNNNGDHCTFELNENYFLFYNGSMFSHYLFNNYSDAYDYVSNTYNDLNKSSEKTKPKIGMTANEVKSTSWGSPDKVNRTENSSGTHEQWVYRKHGYVYLDNGIVTSISDSY